MMTLTLCALLGLSLVTAGCAAARGGTAAASPLPRVAADCASASPHRLSTRPSSITLACADNGWGVQDLTWTSWTTSAAVGHGVFWDKLCKPSCAAGKIGTYPVAIRLSAVKTTGQGRWFSQLTLTWKANRPPRPVPDRFRLAPPLG
ncbi:MAG TPA: hypothetical protein VGI96_20675 [Streptosporangiaceae bacterium]